jgi:hypothetical protein
MPEEKVKMIKFFGICNSCFAVHQAEVPYNLDWETGEIRCHCGALINITSKEALES